MKDGFIVVDSMLLGVCTISLVLLVKLCFFHVYLCKKGISTYELILRSRKKNRVGPVHADDSGKTSPKFKRMKKILDEESQKAEADESNDVMNSSLNKSYQSHCPIERPIREANGTIHNDTLKDTKSILGLETNVKNREVFETKDETSNKREIETKVNSHQSILILQPVKEENIHPSKFLKDKRSTQNQGLDSNLENESKIPSVKLEPPIPHNREKSNVEEPGDWTLRNNQNQQ